MISIKEMIKPMPDRLPIKGARKKNEAIPPTTAPAIDPAVAAPAPAPSAPAAPAPVPQQPATADAATEGAPASAGAPTAASQPPAAASPAAAAPAKIPVAVVGDNIGYVGFDADEVAEVIGSSAAAQAMAVPSAAASRG